MERAARLLAQVIADEQGGEVLEYALIAGLMVIGAVLIISKVGTRTLAKWKTIKKAVKK